MEITDIKIRRIITEGRLRAVVSVTVDNMLAVHDIKVVQGDERLFVAMPSRKDENGVFRDIVHPISAAARKMMESQILEAYHEHLALMEAEARQRQLRKHSRQQSESSASILDMVHRSSEYSLRRLFYARFRMCCVVTVPFAITRLCAAAPRFSAKRSASWHRESRYS